MSDVFSRIWQVMETDPGHRGLTTDLPRADLKKLGFSLLEAGEVFVISGFPVQRAGGKGETDGPIGTANLAAVLEQVGKKVTVITDEASCEAMLAACAIYAPSAEVLCVPHKGAQAFCYSLLKHHKPTHVIAIERPGRGADGHFHNFRGEYIDDLLSDTDLLMEQNFSCCEFSAVNALDQHIFTGAELFPGAHKSRITGARLEFHLFEDPLSLDNDLDRRAFFLLDMKHFRFKKHVQLLFELRRFYLRHFQSIRSPQKGSCGKYASQQYISH